MPPPALLPPPLRGRPFTVAEALALGVTPAQLRTSAVRAPHRGVRVPAGLADSLEVRCAAARLVLPADAAFTGRTARALCRLPEPFGAQDVLTVPLQVAVPPPGRAPRIHGVEARQSRWAATVLQLPTGLSVVHPAHLWCDVAPGLSLVDAVALGDAVRRRWASTRVMSAAVLDRDGDRGVVALRHLLGLVRYPVDSPMETRARLLLTGAGLPEPVCGRDVSLAGGWIARPDLSWPHQRVAVEYDGDHHRTDARQWRSDIRRRELLESAGWRVVVLTADDLLRRPEQTVALVAQALRNRGLSW